MKLAFCLFNYFSYGGMQRTFFRIAQMCHEHGHEIHIYTMEWQGEIPTWINLTLIKKQGLSNHQRAWNFSKQLQALLKNKSYDRIIGFNKLFGLDIYYAGDGCFIAKNQYQHFWNRLSSRFRTYAKLERAVFNNNAKTEILLISKPEKIKYQHYYQTQDARMHLLPPGIRREHIRPANALEIREKYRKEFKLNDDDFALLTIASRFKTKGLDRSIAALASLPEAIKKKTFLFIVGNDKQEKYQHKNLNLVFLNSRDDVASLLLMADLLIHPARLENTGSTLLEAMLAGTPTLVTDCCGYAHYITESNAGKLIATPFKQQEMNQLLLGMLNKEALLTWQQNALNYCKTADFFSLIEKAVQFIEQALPFNHFANNIKKSK